MRKPDRVEAFAAAHLRWVKYRCVIPLEDAVERHLAMSRSVLAALLIAGGHCLWILDMTDQTIGSIVVAAILSGIVFLVAARLLLLKRGERLVRSKVLREGTALGAWVGLLIMLPCVIAGSVYEMFTSSEAFWHHLGGSLGLPSLSLGFVVAMLGGRHRLGPQTSDLVPCAQ